MASLEIRVEAIAEQAVNRLLALDRQIQNLAARTGQLDVAMGKASRSATSLGNVRPPFQGFADSAGAASRGLAGLDAGAARLVPSLGGVGSAVTGLVGALGGMVIISQITRSFNDFVRAGDELAAFSRQTGIAATEISKLPSAGQLFHVEQAELLTGLRFLQRAIADLASGETSAGAEALRKLVGDIREGGQIRPTIDVFFEVGDAIAKMGNESQRTTALMDVFGRGGATLARIFGTEGAAGFRKAAEEAERLGRSMSGEAIESASRLDDAMKKLKQTTDSFSADAFRPFADLFADMADDAASSLASIKKALDEMGHRGAAGREAARRQFPAFAEQEDIRAQQLQRLAPPPAAPAAFVGPPSPSPRELAIRAEIANLVEQQRESEIQIAASLRLRSGEAGKEREIREAINKLLERQRDLLIQGEAAFRVERDRFKAAGRGAEFGQFRQEEIVIQPRVEEGRRTFVGPPTPSERELDIRAELRSIEDAIRQDEVRREAIQRRFQEQGGGPELPESIRELRERADQARPSIDDLSDTFRALGQVGIVTKSHTLALVSALGEMVTRILELVQKLRSSSGSTGGGLVALATDIGEAAIGGARTASAPAARQGFTIEPEIDVAALAPISLDPPELRIAGFEPFRMEPPEFIVAQPEPIRIEGLQIFPPEEFLRNQQRLAEERAEAGRDLARTPRPARRFDAADVADVFGAGTGIARAGAGIGGRLGAEGFAGFAKQVGDIFSKINLAATVIDAMGSIVAGFLSRGNDEARTALQKFNVELQRQLQEGGPLLSAARERGGLLETSIRNNATRFGGPPTDPFGAGSTVGISREFGLGGGVPLPTEIPLLRPGQGRPPFIPQSTINIFALDTRSIEEFYASRNFGRSMPFLENIGRVERR